MKLNTCNRHEDCNLAEQKYWQDHPRSAEIGYLPPGFHCYDDCCEDCFGS